MNIIFECEWFRSDPMWQQTTIKERKVRGLHMRRRTCVQREKKLFVCFSNKKISFSIFRHRCDIGIWKWPAKLVRKCKTLWMLISYFLSLNSCQTNSLRESAKRHFQKSMYLTAIKKIDLIIVRTKVKNKLAVLRFPDPCDCEIGSRSSTPVWRYRAQFWKTSLSKC